MLPRQRSKRPPNRFCKMNIDEPWACLLIHGAGILQRGPVARNSRWMFEPKSEYGETVKVKPEHVEIGTWWAEVSP